MGHYNFFLEEIRWALTSVPAFLVVCSVFTALAVIVFVFFGSILAFAWHQAKNIHTLYTRPVQIDVENLQPYTKSILNNSCRELLDLQHMQERLKRNPTEKLKTSALIKIEIMTTRLELYESNREICSRIVQALLMQKKRLQGTIWKIR